jgi:hypothetical protein
MGMKLPVGILIYFLLVPMETKRESHLLQIPPDGSKRKEKKN